jgi:hypothetical protein
MSEITANSRIIIGKVNEIIQTNIGVPEVEIRIRNVNQNAYLKALNKMRDLSSEVLTKSTDYIIDGIRHTTYFPDASLGKHIAVKKTSVYNLIIDKYNLKLSVASEQTIIDETIENDILSDSKFELKRTKTRHTFMMDDIQVDFTEVVSLSSSNPRIPNSFEIEMEIPTGSDVNPEIIAKLQTVTLKVLGLVQDSLRLYTQPQLNSLIDSYNTILGAPMENRSKGGVKVLSHVVMSQARNLKRADCVDGGLISQSIKSPSSYSITHKVRGNRKLLVIHETGVWMVHAPHDTNLVIPRQKGEDKFIDSLKGTILDGENLIIGGQNVYIPFDILSYRGSIEIQGKHHLERMSLSDKIMKLQYFNTEGGTIKGMTKEFIHFKTRKELLDAIDKLKSDVLPYSTDGFIFTPNEAPYRIIQTEPELYKRTLSLYPEICKLKPWEDLTIDFQYRAPRQLLVNIPVGGFHEVKQVLFTGSLYHSFDLKTQVDWDHELFKDLSDGVIIEMGPRNDGNTIVLFPHLIRTNKQYPNQQRIAASNWDDINRPIDIDTLRGRNFDLVFQYHNTEKRRLLSQIPAGSDIIDIGAGKGGDLSKMTRAHHIVAVEPNPENAEEYRKRSQINIKGEKMSSKITLLETGGEDTNTIVKAAYDSFGWEKPEKRRPLYITMMLSLSFFFEESMFNKLVKTLSVIAGVYVGCGGKEVNFYFMTIEKKPTLQIIQKRGPEFKLGPAEFKFSQPNILHVNIPGTIVENQTEYLVDITKLKNALKFEETKISQCLNEKMLSPQEMEYSSMFVVGSVKFKAVSVTPLFLDKPSGKIINLSEIPDVVIEEPHLITVNNGHEYYGFEMDDFFEAYAKSQKESGRGREYREKYKLWLVTPDLGYTADQIIEVFKFNPVEDIYAGKIPANVNFYTAESGKYYDKFKRSGLNLSFLLDLLQKPNPLDDNTVSAFAEMVGKNIMISEINGELISITSYNEDEKVKVLLLRNSSSLYTPLGFKYQDGFNFNL